MISICAVLLCICSLFAFIPINNGGVVKANTFGSTSVNDSSFVYTNTYNVSNTYPIGYNQFNPYLSLEYAGSHSYEFYGNINNCSLVWRYASKSAGDTSLSFINIDNLPASSMYDFIFRASNIGNTDNLFITANFINATGGLVTYSSYNYNSDGNVSVLNNLLIETPPALGDGHTRVLLWYSAVGWFDTTFDAGVKYLDDITLIPHGTNITTPQPYINDINVNTTLSMYYASTVDVRYMTINCHQNDIYYRQDTNYFIDNSITNNGFDFTHTFDLSKSSFINSFTANNDIAVNYPDTGTMSLVLSNGNSTVMYNMLLCVNSSSDNMLSNKFQQIIYGSYSNRAIFDSLFGSIPNLSNLITSIANSLTNGQWSYVIYQCANGSAVGFVYFTTYDYGSVSYYIDANVNATYDLGYGFGYDEGYSIGYDNGNNYGYNRGYNLGNNVGYNRGYNDGVANHNDYSFLSLISAVIDAPIKYFQSLFNFELLGVNLQGFITGLFTLAVIITIIRMVL